MFSARTTILLSVLTGVTIEVAVSAAGGRRESWDSTIYWIMGIPAALLASVAIGFLSRGTDWVWALAIVPSQVATMALKTRDFGLLPFTLILSLFLSLPFLVAAFAGAKLRRGGT